MIADVPVHALLIAIVRRRDLDALPQEWVAPGVYVLIGPADGQSPTPVYVGQARDVRKRLVRHRAAPKLDWWRAVAIKRDTTHGFNSAEIGYLEGRLAAELGSLPNVEVIEGKRDLDTTLPEHHRLALDAFVPSILAALRIVGIDLASDRDDASDEQPSAKRTRATIPGTVADLLAAGLLSAGSVLTFKRAGRSATARVTASGELVVDGVTYASPSTAAAKALGLKAANGWISWRLDGGSGPTLADLREQLLQREAG